MSDPERTIWCGNLSSEVKDGILYELFLQAGPLERVHRPRDQKTSEPRAFAFITYEDEESVPYALELYRETELFGRPLRLQAQGEEAKKQALSNGRSERRFSDLGGGRASSQSGSRERPSGRHEQNYGDRREQSYNGRHRQGHDRREQQQNGRPDQGYGGYRDQQYGGHRDQRQTGRQELHYGGGGGGGLYPPWQPHWEQGHAPGERRRREAAHERRRHEQRPYPPRPRW